MKLNKGKIINFYFSGTGNTERLVKHFSDYLNSRGYESSVFKMEKDRVPREEGDFTLGLMFPVAVQSTFPLVWDFIENLPDGGGRDVFMFDTMEAWSGGIVGPLRKKLARKGYNCMGAREFTMSSSLNTNSDKVAAGKIKNARAMTNVIEYADDLIRGRARWRRIPLLSDMMRSFSRSRGLWQSMSRALTVGDGCIQCRKCLRDCPAGAIGLKDGLIAIDSSRCNSCMRCAAGCPVRCIRYKGKELQLAGGEGK